MDALLTTLLATAIAGMGDRPQLLCAVLAIRFGVSRGGLIAILIVCSGLACVSAAAGALVSTWISEEPTRLFQALSFLFAGAGMLAWRQKLDTLGSWSTGPFITMLLGLTVLSLGDKSQFLIVGSAARTGAPVLAALGGFIGTLIPCLLGWFLGERLSGFPAIRWLRTGGGVAFLLIGAAMALSAWGLLG